MQKYILKNKDIDILSFEYFVEQKQDKYGLDIRQSFQNITILNADLLPLSLALNKFDEGKNGKALDKWIRRRKIPSHRRFARDILAAAGIDEGYLDSYISVSLGLSLNDSLWIVPADGDYKWQDFSLYENKFSEALQFAAFGVISSKLKHTGVSPELSTNGMLPKCWHRKNNQIYLYKGAAKMNGGADEPYSEFYMAQIAAVMGFECVPYDLGEFNGQLVSTCPIFTSENEGYLPIGYYLDKSERKYKGAELASTIAKIYDKGKFEDLMLFDALVCNTDRHLGNFGFIVDNNANKILRPAPIFDNGLSLMSYVGFDELAHQKKIISFITGYFDYNFDEQLKIFVKPRHIANLEKLASFKFKKHSEFNLSDEWLEPIQKCMQERAKLALQFACEK